MQQIIALYAKGAITGLSPNLGIQSGSRNFMLNENQGGKRDFLKIWETGEVLSFVLFDFRAMLFSILKHASSGVRQSPKFSLL